MPNNFTLPLFPLSAHLLPGGRLALRIFEPRYTNMIKQACANNTGFGICMLDAKGDKEKNQHIHPIGTLANVIDFDLLKDGLLGVTVEGSRSFKINAVHTADDGLRNAQIQWLTPWRCEQVPEKIKPLSDRLVQIFKQYPELQNLYDQPHFDDPIWVIHRWIELVPIEPTIKQQLLAEKDCMKALSFLTQLSD